MFDTAEIKVKAGDGGSGAISFRREKFVPYGGPDGGDGGNGGDAVFVVETGITNLLMFRRKAFYKAGRGGNGQGSKKHGARGEDLVLMVPLGTVISETDISGDVIILADLEEPGQRVVGERAAVLEQHQSSEEERREASHCKTHASWKKHTGDDHVEDEEHGTWILYATGEVQQRCQGQQVKHDLSACQADGVLPSVRCCLITLQAPSIE